MAPSCGRPNFNSVIQKRVRCHTHRFSRSQTLKAARQWLTRVDTFVYRACGPCAKAVAEQSRMFEA